ncbi:MAG: hypothetical protein RR725_06235, partial [Carnobacterium sp.]|uniref:hypothetical protein n=1 Tax=Carnobacterium sp. TaxID=48221 RepID=UPI002FCA269B
LLHAAKTKEVAKVVAPIKAFLLIPVFILSFSFYIEFEFTYKRAVSGFVFSVSPHRLYGYYRIDPSTIRSKKTSEAF